MSVRAPAPTAQAAPTTSGPPPVLPTLIAPAGLMDTTVPYTLRQERAIGKYAIRLWRPPPADRGASSFDGTVTLAAVGQPAIVIPWATAIDPLTGTDLTGEGTPDLVVQSFTGGAHCCFQTLVYDLGVALTPVLRTPPSNCLGKFEDVDRDGRREFVTCDDLFAYAYCPFAFSPMPKVVLAYERGRGFVPAGPRFAAAYADDIAAHTRALEAAATAPATPSGVFPSPDRCAVLALVLDHLYAGQTATAWAAFERFYPQPGAPSFRADIEAQVGASPLYALPGAERIPVVAGDAPATLAGTNP